MGLSICKVPSVLPLFMASDCGMSPGIVQTVVPLFKGDIRHRCLAPFDSVRQCSTRVRQHSTTFDQCSTSVRPTSPFSDSNLRQCSTVFRQTSVGLRPNPNGVQSPARSPPVHHPLWATTPVPQPCTLRSLNAQVREKIPLSMGPFRGPKTQICRTRA